MHVDYIHPLSSSLLLLSHLLCAKVDFPSQSRLDKEQKPPQIFQKACCFDECITCHAFLQSKSCMLSCPALFDNSICYRWKEYGMVLLENGTEIKELTMKRGNVTDFKNKFIASLLKYKKHYFTYKWLNLCRYEDMIQLKPNSLYIQTDYSAQPTLDSQDKLNSVGHGVCVLSCWVVLHSPREEFYVDNNGDRIGYTFYECDHIRVVSPSTGKCKDQDWFLHCKEFEVLIKSYQVSIPNLLNVVVWTDGAPNQYKCRQNFYWLSTVHHKFGLNIKHRFGATAQFKGVHDKIGQVAKWTVRCVGLLLI